jgi:hypothetical protein
MACTSLTTIAKDCFNNTGGLKGIWIFDMEDIVAPIVTVSLTGLVTSMSIGAAPTAYFLKPYTANYTEVTAEEFTNGNATTTTTIALAFNRREATKSRSLKIMGEGQRYLGALLLDGNGIYWLATDVRLSEVGEGSGTTRTDGSKYSVTFISENDDTNYVVSDVDAAAFISTGIIV